MSHDPSLASNIASELEGSLQRAKQVDDISKLSERVAVIEKSYVNEAKLSNMEKVFMKWTLGVALGLVVAAMSALALLFNFCNSQLPVGG